ncbi:glutathione transferase GstA [Kushneria phyllosphaerae]|uniref:Glutathione S-transferase GST-6.0 n=1 Tax=Kushneria phyllosphaerae TaxID=2100822 RepID=A0A2R8CLS7_9GAMM|nr:glutathione transferase GstA [Kushneria phyllosphaerae]SPJ33792.1 Glutathione S-transferase GST-6.0 [Kushneria phyllosphaerae]
MKLYYAPHTCSLSPHIVLKELSLPFELIRVDNRTKQTADGQDFLRINPKGYVAALEIEQGRVITEGPAILQYLADLRPEAGLIPIPGGWERVQMQEWLAFINSEVHAGLAPLFNKELPHEARAIFSDRISKRFDFLESRLRGNRYLMGSSFSVADAYLFTVLGWCRFFDISLEKWPALMAYKAVIEERSSVQAAMAAEREQD